MFKEIQHITKKFTQYKRVLIDREECYLYDCVVHECVIYFLIKSHNPRNPHKEYLINGVYP